MPSSPRIVAFCALAVLAGACANDRPDNAGSPSVTVPFATGVPTTSPFEVVVTEKTVRVSTTGITTTDGVVLLAFTAPEQACVVASAGTIADIAGTLQSPPATDDAADAQQTLAEVVVGCVPFDRFQSVVADQLAAQSALSGIDEAGIDRACLDREVASLQDTPDVLASVLRGDPDALSAIAGTASTNCR